MNRSTSFFSGILIPLGYVVFSLLALINYAGDFSPLNNWLSDLGSQGLNPAGWGYYNAGIILTGVLLQFFFWGLTVWKLRWNRKQNLMVTFSSIAGSLGGLSMILSAVFPIDKIEIHSFFSAALYILIGSAFVFISLAFLYLPKFPRWMSVLGFIIAIVDLLWSVFLNTYLMEFFVVGCFLLFCLLLGLQTATRNKYMAEVR